VIVYFQTNTKCQTPRRNAPLTRFSNRLLRKPRLKRTIIPVPPQKHQSKLTTMSVTPIATEPLQKSNISKNIEVTRHSTYPFPIPTLPTSVSESLALVPVKSGKKINDQADLDLLYFEPFVSKNSERQIFKFLRAELPFYRVQYVSFRRNKHLLCVSNPITIQTSLTMLPFPVENANEHTLIFDRYNIRRGNMETQINTPRLV
jgi:hypothetical protein